MNNLFFIIFLLSFPTFAFFVTRFGIAAVKKNKEHRSKFLKFSGITFAVMIVSIIAFTATAEPIEQADKEEPEKIEVSATVVEDEVEPELTEEENAEIAKLEEDKKVAAEAKAKEDAEKEDKEVVQSKEPAKNVSTGSKPKIESTVKDSIHKHFGKTSNIDKRKNIVDVSFNEEIGLLTAIVLGNDNLSTKFIVGGMHKAVAGVAQDMKDVAEVKELMIFVQFPLVDAYGNEEDGDVMRVNLTRSTLDKLNFDNFDYNKVPDIADSYFLHKALQ